VRSTRGGSVTLLSDDNAFTGGLAVRSSTTDTAQTPWADNAVAFGGHDVAMQGRVRVAATTVRVGGAGIEADVVTIRASQLSTAPDAVIAARLPFDNLVGTTTQTPGLTLELRPDAFTTPSSFGVQSAPIGVNVGSRAWGNRALPVDGGYVSVLPRNGAHGSTAVLLAGPPVANGYGFFFDGAGLQTEIPVFYNGVLPVTPQVSGSISATVAVSENARRERFEEAVRTENVATRLRAGVIAEVGAGRPATVGTEGARPPAACAPAGGTLGCAPAAPATTTP